MLCKHLSTKKIYIRDQRGKSESNKQNNKSVTLENYVFCKNCEKIIEVIPNCDYCDKKASVKLTLVHPLFIKTCLDNGNSPHIHNFHQENYHVIKTYGAIP